MKMEAIGIGDKVTLYFVGDDEPVRDLTIDYAPAFSGDVWSLHAENGARYMVQNFERMEVTPPQEEDSP